MKINSKKSSFIEQKTEALIVLIPAGDENSSEVLTALDDKSGGFFSELGKDALPVESGDIRHFYNVPNIEADSVVVVATKSEQKELHESASKITKHLKQHKISKAALVAADLVCDDLSAEQIAQILSRSMIDGDYAFNEFKTKKKKKGPEIKVTFLSCDVVAQEVKAGIEYGCAVAEGMSLTKDLANKPSNVCTPKYLAKAAEKLAKEYENLSVEVLSEKEIKQLKMGALMSVAKGSVEPPRLIKFSYQGAKKKDAPIALVGKGVTFDSGGISLKPGASMDEMKYDMCGAASVFGTIKAIAELELPINVIGIVPSVENMPSGRASKPGDIVKSMSGKTIEILNTDAEGRLILCDALSYAQQFKPKAIVDMATLTGACIVALGHHASGLMSNDDELANQLSEAGNASCNRVWRLPLWNEYKKQLDSPFADLQNIGGRDAGTITAGCFLSEFAKDAVWAHLDIAGTAWVSGKNKGATGTPVPLLVEYLKNAKV